MMIFRKRLSSSWTGASLPQLNGESEHWIDEIPTPIKEKEEI
jgi:hypothetical protein